MKPYFERVTIIGAGLLGASLGLALKARGMAGHITGVGHRQVSVDTALSVGAIDEGALDLTEPVKQADLIVLATPSGLVIPKLEEIHAHSRETAVITDVASTKAAICAYADSLFTTPRRFIGSHPMAGSEQFGPEHAQADFYEGSICLVEQADTLDQQALDQVQAVWKAVGCQIIPVEAGLHDQILARTSHIPHILAAAMASQAVALGDIQAMIGGGFRDCTRIAASRPEIWRDICLTNREAVLEGLQSMQACLGAFETALQAGDADALEAFFEAGRDARNKVVDA